MKLIRIKTNLNRLCRLEVIILFYNHLWTRYLNTYYCPPILSLQFYNILAIDIISFNWTDCIYYGCFYNEDILYSKQQAMVD